MIFSDFEKMVTFLETQVLPHAKLVYQTRK